MIEGHLTDGFSTIERFEDLWRFVAEFHKHVDKEFAVDFVVLDHEKGKRMLEGEMTVEFETFG